MPMSIEPYPGAGPASRPRRPIGGRFWEPLVPWLIGTIAACWLYFGRTVLIPIILAIFLSFLLSPVVAGFRRAGLPRTPSVMLALLLALGGIGLTGTVIFSQAATLSADAPAYAERIAQKAVSIREGVRARIGLLTRDMPKPSARRIAQRAREKGQQSLSARQGPAAIPVEVHNPPPTAIQEIEAFVVPALAPIETVLIVLVVTVFILFQREDLRDRLIRLMGTADLHRSTIALDDAAKRLSRYFLSQFVVNCGFGAIIWGALFLLGIPSPGLWGILAGLLRFVPYVGPIVAALGPMAIAAAIDPGWSLVTFVALLFLILEPVTGYVVEPMIYGHSTGLSPVSVIIAALFWTWIWGPVGLVLSMPLTLMLVVLGRHVPAFEVFDIMLGDRPALSPAETYYQRALAGHSDDALEQAEEMLETLTLVQYYEEVVLPGLRLAAADVDRGVVERSAMRGIGSATTDLLAALADQEDMVVVEATESPLPSSLPDLSGRSIICVPGPGPLAGAVSMMIAQVLRRCGAEVREEPRDRLRGGSTPFDPAGADTICLLGLFDGRAAVRMKRVARSTEQRFGSVRAVVGVQRDMERAVAPKGSEMLPFLISEFAAELKSAGPGSD